MRQLLVAAILMGSSFLSFHSTMGRQAKPAEEPVSDQTPVAEENQTWAYLGVKGGAHFSSVYFSDTFRPVVMRTGIAYASHFGFVGKIFLDKHAGIQAEVVFVEKGYEQVFLQSEGFYAAKMNYLEIPVMANAYFGKKRSEIFVNAGPYFEMFLSQQQTKIGQETEEEEFYPFDPESDRTLGYGMRAAAGINRRFIFGLVQLEAGMTFSISDMLVTNRLVSQVPDGSKHYTGFLSLSYMIPIGKKPMP